MTGAPLFGAAGGPLELAGGAVVVFGGTEAPELVTTEVDSAGTVTAVEPEEPGGVGLPVLSDAGGMEPTDGVASEDCGVTGGGGSTDDAGGPGGPAEVTGGLPPGGKVPEAGGGDSIGVVPGAGGGIEAGGGDSIGVVPGAGGGREGGGGVSIGGVPGTGGVTEAGGTGPHSVTVTVVVTVFAPSGKSKN